MSRIESGSKKGALGKGISSLLKSTEIEEPSEVVSSPVVKTQTNNEPKFLYINLDQIIPNPTQPRKVFLDNKLKEMSESIKQDGVLQAIVVSKDLKTGKYLIIAGERRWRASKLAGKTAIPAIIKKQGESTEIFRLALVENIQREDLNVIEEAEAYLTLIEDCGYTQDICAKKVGKDRSTVSNILRLLNLPKEIQNDIVTAKMSMGHARAILGLDDKKMMLRARDIVIKKKLNVRQTEKLCNSFKKGVTNTPQEKNVNPDVKYVIDNLRNYFHTKVNISGNDKKGKIEISFFSAAELERIINKIGCDIS